MFKLLIRLAIVALLANACYRIGSEYLNHIRFRDAMRDVAMFKARNNEELRQRIMDLSAEFDVPLQDDALTISRQDRRVSIEGDYRKPIEIVPRFAVPWHFSWAIEVITSPLLPPPPPKT